MPGVYPTSIIKSKRPDPLDLFVLLSGIVVKNSVNAFGIKNAFHRGPSHDCDGAGINKRLKDRIEQHPCCLLRP